MDKKEEMNAVLARLTDFANSKGGPSKIYNAIGKQVSTYWNLVKNDSKPSVDTLIQFAEVYSDFDLNYILLGKKSADRIKQLEMQVNFLTDMYEQRVRSSGSVGKHKGATISPGDRAKTILGMPLYEWTPKMNFDQLLVASIPQSYAIQ